jgi:copper(I)-binding protein
MAMDNGVMKMRPVNGGLTVPPGQSVTLAPGGYHLMMLGLTAPLKKGGTVPVTLKFENAGEVKVTLDIEGIGAMDNQTHQTAPGAQQQMKTNSGHKM